MGASMPRRPRRRSRRGAGEEVLSGVREQDGRRDERAPPPEDIPQRQPPGGVGSADEVGRQREVHHHHPHEAREHEPRRVAAARLGLNAFAVARVQGPRAIADPAHGREDSGEREPGGVPPHAHALARVVAGRLDDARQRAQAFFVQPQARRAADALEQQRGLADAAAVAAEERGLQIFPVEEPVFSADSAGGAVGAFSVRSR